MDFVRVGYFIPLNGPLNGRPPSNVLRFTVTPWLKVITWYPFMSISCHFTYAVSREIIVNIFEHMILLSSSLLPSYLPISIFPFMTTMRFLIFFGMILPLTFSMTRFMYKQTRFINERNKLQMLLWSRLKIHNEIHVWCLPNEPCVMDTTFL